MHSILLARSESIVSALIGAIVISLVLAPIPGVIAKSNNDAKAVDVAILGWLGLVFPPLWLVAMAWALIGSPARDAASTSGRGDYEIIGKNAQGKQERFTVQARDADEARFLAAEKGIEIVGLRRLERIRRSILPEDRVWLVEGSDKAGKTVTEYLPAATRELAYVEACKSGMVRVNRIILFRQGDSRPHN